MKKLLLLFLPFLLLVVLAGCANFGTSSLPYPSTPPTATSGEGVFDISIETYTGEGLVDQTYYFAKYDDTYVLLYVDNVSEGDAHIWNMFNRNAKHIKITDAENIQILRKISTNLEYKKPLGVMNNGVKMLGEYVYIRTTYQQFATFGNLLPHDDSTTKTIIFPYHIATDMVGERIEIPAMLFVPFDMQGGILIGKKFECFECDGNVAPDVILYNPAYTVLANIGYVKEVKIHPKEENGEYAYISYEPFNITYKACPDKDLCEVETIYTPSGVRQSYVNPYLWGMDI